MFAGDLVGRGPGVVNVLKLVMVMVEDGAAPFHLLASEGEVNTAKTTGGTWEWPHASGKPTPSCSAKPSGRW